MYLLCWKKPREVKEPTLLGKEAAEGMAFMCMCSRMSGESEVKKGLLPGRVAAVPDIMQYDFVEDSYTPAADATGLHGPTVSFTLPEDVINLEPFGDLSTTDSKATLHEAIQVKEWNNADDLPQMKALRQGRFVPCLSGAPQSDAAAEPDPTMKQRHYLASRAFENYPQTRQLFTQNAPIDPRGPTRYSAPAAQFVVPYAPNWPGD